MAVLERRIEGRVLVVTLDNPPVHALSGPLIDALTTTFRATRDDDSMRAVVLTASGERAFCAGADLRAVRSRDGMDRPSQIADPGRAAREMLESIFACPVPIVAAVNGPAVGGGVSLLAMCDVALAVSTAWIQTPEIEVGLLGAFSHLSRLVGERRARRLYLSGARCEAAELVACGAYEAVVEPGELQERALAVAEGFASKPPIAMRLAKEAIGRVESLPVLEAYRLEQDYTTRLRSFGDVSSSPW